MFLQPSPEKQQCVNFVPSKIALAPGCTARLAASRDGTRRRSQHNDSHPRDPHCTRWRGSCVSREYRLQRTSSSGTNLHGRFFYVPAFAFLFKFKFSAMTKSSFDTGRFCTQTSWRAHSCGDLRRKPRKYLTEKFPSHSSKRCGFLLSLRACMSTVLGSQRVTAKLLEPNFGKLSLATFGT